MARIILLPLMSLSLVLAACSPAATPTPKSTQPPAEALSTATVTLHPETLIATFAAETVTAQLSALETDLQLAGFSTKSGRLAWSQIAPVTLSVDAINSSVSEPLTHPNPEFANFILGVDIYWESGEDGLNGCDIILRSEPDIKTGKQIVLETFRYGGIYEFSWQISRAEGGFAGDAIGNAAGEGFIDQTSGSSNHYVIVAEGPNVTVYANGALFATADLGVEPASGALAFSAWQLQGPVTTCTFSNAFVWELPN